MGSRMAVLAAACSAAGILSPLHAARGAEEQLERASHGLRSSAAELERSLSALDDLTAGYAGGAFVPDGLRSELREEVSERSRRLWHLRTEFWELDDQVRLARGAEAIGSILTGRPAAGQARAALDSDGARDLGEWTRVLCDHARTGLDREGAAYAAATALRAGARRRLWGAGALGAAAGALLAALLRRRSGP